MDVPHDSRKLSKTHTKGCPIFLKNVKEIKGVVSLADSYFTFVHGPC